MKLVTQRLFRLSTANPIRAQSNQDNDLFIIRHAQSNFNKGSIEFKNTNKIEKSWEQIMQLQGYRREVGFSAEFIDCSITEVGKQQCKKARDKLKDKQIDVVLVSPHQRTLQTCREIFAGRKIKVQVHPILAEVLRFSCDIGGHSERKIKEFSEYDFSFMKDYSELWYVDIQNQDIKDTFKMHLNSHRELSYQEKQIKLLQLMKSKVVYQSAQALRKRTQKIKELLGEYKKKHRSIAIVSHFYILATLMTSQFNETDEAVNLPNIQNATPHSLSIEKLLQVQ